MSNEENKAPDIILYIQHLKNGYRNKFLEKMYTLIEKRNDILINRECPDSEKRLREIKAEMDAEKKTALTKGALIKTTNKGIHSHLKSILPNLQFHNLSPSKHDIFSYGDLLLPTPDAKVSEDIYKYLISFFINQSTLIAATIHGDIRIDSNMLKLIQAEEISKIFFDGSVFNSELSYSNVEFGESVRFVGSEFKKQVSFTECTFSGPLSIDYATLHGNLSFLRCKFKDLVTIERTKFIEQRSLVGEQPLSFAYCAFHDRLVLDSDIKEIPEMRGTHFVGDGKIVFGQDFKISSKPEEYLNKDITESDKRGFEESARILRQACAKFEDRHYEMFFQEYEYNLQRSLKIDESWAIKIYSWFSYGRSIAIPAVSLVMYYLFLVVIALCYKDRNDVDSLVYFLATPIPLGRLPDIGLNPLWVIIVVLLKLLLAALFFLLGLAIRNKFKLWRNG